MSDHGERVSRLAEAVARRMGLGAEEVEAVRVSGLLHDLGKNLLPEPIIAKPGPLTPEEFAEIKRHPDASVEIARKRKGVSGAALECIRHHHERLDGTGYPAGLKGEAITLPMRILAVVNVFDALAWAQPYKPAFPLATCLRILKEEVDRNWWDPQVVEVLSRLVGEEKEGPGTSGVPARLRPTDPPRVPPDPLARREDEPDSD